MKCSQCKDRLFAYIEGLIEDRSKSALESHLQGCSDCRREEQALRELQSRLSVHGQAAAQVHLETDVLGAIIREQKTQLKETDSGVPIGRRPLMKHPIFRIAVAAAVIAACVAGMLLFSGTQSIALADVLTRIERVGAYLYRMDMTTSMTGVKMPGQPQHQDIEGTVLISPAYGMKMTMATLNDPNEGKRMVQEQYFQPQHRRMLMLMTDQKKYMEVELNDQLVEQTRQQTYDPRMIVEQLLQCECQALGRSLVNGIAVEGFQTSDPAYMGGGMGEVDVTLWVDVETGLPVQLEMDFDIPVPGKTPGQMRMVGVLSGFQWDVPVEEAEFDPVIPEDYTPLAGGTVNMPDMNEANTIAGLRHFKALTGRYPEDLSFATLMGQMGKLTEYETPAAQALKASLKDADQETSTRKMIDTMLPIQTTAGFYAMLVQGGKDPVYYGKLVTPETPDLILLRWQVSENEYRVVFGNLQAETVTASQLAELEGALSH